MKVIMKVRTKLDHQNLKCRDKEHLSLDSQKKKHQTELKIWKNINLLSGDGRNITQIKINYTYITKNSGIMMNYFVRKNILFHLAFQKHL